MEEESEHSTISGDSTIVISSDSEKSIDIDVEGMSPEHFVKEEPSEEMQYILKIAKQVEESQGSEELFSPEEEPATQQESQYEPTPAMKYPRKVAKQVEMSPEPEYETGNTSKKQQATATTSKASEGTKGTTAEAEHGESPYSTPTMSPTASELEELSRYNAQQAEEEEEAAYYEQQVPDYNPDEG